MMEVLCENGVILGEGTEIIGAERDGQSHQQDCLLGGDY